MKKILFSLVCIAAAACNNAPFTVTTADALVKIFPADTVYKAAPSPLEIARGENATFQFVVDAEEDLTNVSVSSVKINNDDMTVRTIGVIDYVKSVLDYDMRDDEALLPEDRLYPDPIITDTLVNIAKGTHRCFWVDIDVPVNVKPGEYTAVVKVSSDEGCRDAKAKIKVYPVAVEQQRLLVTNWMYMYSTYFNAGEWIWKDNPLWWELYAKLAEMARDYGNNVWKINQKCCVSSTSDGKDFVFDFSDFDKEVEFLIEHGGLKEMHGTHFGGRDAWVAHYKFNYYALDGKGGVVEKSGPAEDKALQAYINAYFPALVSHLKEKKLEDGRCWLDIYRQFIADEPIDFNIADWEKVAGMIKAAAPEIKTIEAYRSSKADRSLIDFPCPQEDELYWHEIFHNLNRSDNVWMYTCMYPREKYPNRFLDQILIKTRLVHWINYQYNCIGYLHWGYNYWAGPVDYWKKQGVENTPFGIVSTGEWPGGDSHIIYPGYHKFYPSIRLCAMRDGIRDYELLRMVEDKDEAKARELSGAVIHGLQDYETDVDFFREIRHQILEYLSE